MPSARRAAARSIPRTWSTRSASGASSSCATSSSSASGRASTCARSTTPSSRRAPRRCRWCARRCCASSPASRRRRGSAVSERFAGRYLLVRPLGQGGMGEVFLARDLATGSECALKRLPARAGLLPPDALAREFEALTRVRHPEIVAVYELGFAPEGTPYYTMEYVPGLPADRAIARGDWAALGFTAARVAHGLEALHAAGVLHGDLKPSNVMVVPGAARALPVAVRLLDFGLAALLGGERRGHRGTPGYAAPEVVRGEEQSVAADLYGLGAMLYALIAGRPAFEAEDVSALLQRQQAGPPSAVPLEEAGAPPAL